MEWLLQLLVTIAFAFFVDFLIDKIATASAPISSSVSPLSLSFNDHSPASFPPVTS